MYTMDNGERLDLPIMFPLKCENIKQFCGIDIVKIDKNLIKQISDTNVILLLCKKVNGYVGGRGLTLDSSTVKIKKVIDYYKSKDFDIYKIIIPIKIDKGFIADYEEI